MRRQLVVLGVLGALAIAAAGCSKPAPSAAGGSPSPLETSSPPCTLPQVADIYDGYHIGVPAGWSLFTMQGTVVVARDVAGTEETVVHPALMVGSDRLEDVFARLLDLLQQQLTGAGVTLSHAGIHRADGMPAASLNLTSPRAAASGEAHLRVLPNSTAHGTQEAVLVGSWAPASQFDSDASLLAQIGDCYGPQPAVMYRVVKDQVFTYPIPPGWSVSHEDQDVLGLSLGTQASVTYAFFQFLTPSTGVHSPPTLLTFAFQRLGLRIDQTLSSSVTAAQPCTSGTCEQELAQFTGTVAGKKVEGLVYLYTSAGPAGTSGYMRLGVADVDQWNALNGALLHMMGGIQHDFTQDIQSWERAETQWNQFSSQVQGFDYALNNVDLVTDPATGQQFEAPYEAWRSTGPDGPGYYDQAGHRLTILTP